MGLSLKQNVKKKKISAEEAYNKLDSLVHPKYKKYVPTLRWLKNIVKGRSLTQILNHKQNKKLNFDN
jgi:hypothetical protein